MRTWLQHFRTSKGLTQLEVANKCGISRSYYADIEGGYRNPKVSTAKDIANELGFDWTVFFEEKCRETRKSKVTA